VGVLAEAGPENLAAAAALLLDFAPRLDEALSAAAASPHAATHSVPGAGVGTGPSAADAGAGGRGLAGRSGALAWRGTWGAAQWSGDCPTDPPRLSVRGESRGQGAASAAGGEAELARLALATLTVCVDVPPPPSPY
jgi:hypothetical protein